MKVFYSIILALSISTYSFSQHKKVVKKNEEWRNNLTPEQYFVLREKGTEAPFSGLYHNHFEKGIYHCAGCNTPLFNSATKYEANTGYATFFDYITPNIKTYTNPKIKNALTEINCAICSGYLGLLFLDGPKNTTGKRYNINSSALIFKKSNTPK